VSHQQKLHAAPPEALAIGSEGCSVCRELLVLHDLLVDEQEGRGAWGGCVQSRLKSSFDLPPQLMQPHGCHREATLGAHAKDQGGLLSTRQSTGQALSQMVLAHACVLEQIATICARARMHVHVHVRAMRTEVVHASHSFSDQRLLLCVWAVAKTKEEVVGPVLQALLLELSTGLLGSCCTNSACSICQSLTIMLGMQHSALPLANNLS